LRLNRLVPSGEPGTVEELISGLRLGELAPPDRPYLVLNMVATADGGAAFGGRTHALGDEIDREMFLALRTQVDCVMVGAGTARVEGYGPMVRAPERRERREREGLAPRPLACLVSGRLDLPADLPLLQDRDSHVVVVSAAAGELSGLAARVEYLRPPATPEGARFGLLDPLRRLRSEHGIRSVLCEGGPRLNRSLIADGLVDELFLTVAPKLVGGTPETTIVAGDAAAELTSLELISALEAAGSVYLRYRVRR
jgi:riboflavin-specific deaminase-like protein